MSKCPFWQAIYKGDASSFVHLFTSVLTFLSNSCSIVLQLLDKKVNTDVNKCTNDGTSPLFIACQKGHYKIVKILLTHGVDSNKSRDDGCSPLQIARLKNHIDVVEELLKVQKSIFTS
jgi:ankyrin repeat protein